MPDPRIKAVQEAFGQLWNETELRCSRTLKRHLVLDRLRGHAERGKWPFEELHMNNFPIDWYCEALSWDAHQFEAENKAYVAGIVRLAERAMQHDGEMPLCDESGQALLGIGFLRWVSADAKQILAGLYLGGMRDNPAVRAQVDQLYGDRLGANGHHTHSSDDSAIVAAGMMLGFGAAVGVWLADAIDSLEKFLPNHNDADYELAQRIVAECPSLPATPADLYSLTYVCTIPEALRGQVPDCSLREMLTLDPVTDQTPLESHLLAAAGRPYARMPMESGEMSNHDLYEWVRGRVEEERKRNSQ